MTQTLLNPLGGMDHWSQWTAFRSTETAVVCLSRPSKASPSPQAWKNTEPEMTGRALAISLRLIQTNGCGEIAGGRIGRNADSGKIE